MPFHYYTIVFCKILPCNMFSYFYNYLYKKELKNNIKESGRIRGKTNSLIYQ